tara:strand:+ start:2309 stop:3355 length:1047 start_codon:yes stop_codon:yes gene_type:complete
MANKSVHQEFNSDAVKYFNINCDPYGVMVDREGTLIKTVYIDESELTYNTLKKILNGKKGQPKMTLYKKAFLFPNSPISQDRVKAALKEHKIRLTNNYEDADLYITHSGISRTFNDGENINGRSMLSRLWNYDSVENDTNWEYIDNYCNDNARAGNSARVILDKKSSEFVNIYNINAYSLPYDSWMLTGLAINTAYEVDVNGKDIFHVDKIMHQSATKVELTQQLLDDIVSLISSGGEDLNMAAAILPTIDYEKNYYLLWQLSQQIGYNLYQFNRNKDVQYWIRVSKIQDYQHYNALDMIKHLEKEDKLDKKSFCHLEPIVRKNIRIENRELYTFRVEVKPEYKKLMI